MKPWRRRLALGTLSVVTFVVTWEVVLALVRWDPFFMTTPSHIGTALREQLLGGRLWRDIGVSAEAFVVGLGLAVVVGIPIGLVMGWRRPAAVALDPLLTALYASPLIALAPLLIITAGVGLGARALRGFLLVVFAFAFNTAAVVR